MQGQGTYGERTVGNVRHVPAAVGSWKESLNKLAWLQFESPLWYFCPKSRSKRGMLSFPRFSYDSRTTFRDNPTDHVFGPEWMPNSNIESRVNAQASAGL